MKVLFTSDDNLTAILRTMVKPGVEVVTLGDEVDSTDIDEVLVLTSSANFCAAVFMEVRAKLATKTKQDCAMRFAIV